MINLIPPTAKKSIVTEYWLRVLTAWCVLWSIAIALGIVVLVPSYVLISGQVNAYKDSAATASQKSLDFDNVSKELANANKQAGTLVGGLNILLISDFITLFKSLAEPGIVLSNINMTRTDAGFGQVQVSGEAVDRQALVAFRERLLARPEVTTVDLPIASLARNKDIQFSLSVGIATSTTP